MNLNEYLQAFKSISYGGRSSLWTELSGALVRQMEKAPAHCDAQLQLETLDQLGKKLHYGYFYAKTAAEMESAITEVRKVRKNIGKQLKQFQGDWCERLEDVASWIFIESVDLLDEYLNLARAMAFKPDMSSARHFYYTNRLRQILRDMARGPMRVLEIGAGAGNLSMLLLHYGLLKDYTIIDLPEMLLMSGLNLKLRLGRECCFLEYPPAVMGRSAHYLVSANQDLAQIPDKIFDLVLNFNSFSEMPPSVVDAYFATLYRTAKPGALFMNVNRIQDHRQEDGRVFEMNPLLFPYDSGDRILVWDVDPFQQFVRQFCRTKAVKSTAIMRSAVLRGS